jgi:hypothetical protein
MAQNAVVPDAGAPLAGVRAVELGTGISAVGAGLVVSLPAALRRDFGADVTRDRGMLPAVPPPTGWR